MISFIFLQINHVIAPYCTKNLNKCQTISLTAQFFALFVGIMIHVTDGTDQQVIDAGSETSSMGVEKSVVNTVILLSNFAVVLFPLSLLLERDSIESKYWKFREKIDNIGCWKMNEYKRGQAPAMEDATLSDARLVCDIINADPLARNEQKHRKDFVVPAPHII